MTTENGITEREMFISMMGAKLYLPEVWETAKAIKNNEAFTRLLGLVERFTQELQERCPEDYKELIENKESFKSFKELYEKMYSEHLASGKK